MFRKSFFIRRYSAQRFAQSSSWIAGKILLRYTGRAPASAHVEVRYEAKLCCYNNNYNLSPINKKTSFIAFAWHKSNAVDLYMHARTKFAKIDADEAWNEAVMGQASTQLYKRQHRAWTTPWGALVVRPCWWWTVHLELAATLVVERNNHLAIHSLEVVVAVRMSALELVTICWIAFLL